MRFTGNAARGEGRDVNRGGAPLKTCFILSREYGPSQGTHPARGRKTPTKNSLTLKQLKPSQDR